MRRDESYGCAPVSIGAVELPSEVGQTYAARSGELLEPGDGEGDGDGETAGAGLDDP